jgi:hypothetical protein
LDIDPQNEYALNLKDRTVAMISNTSWRSWRSADHQKG